MRVRLLYSRSSYAYSISEISYKVSSVIPPIRHFYISYYIVPIRSLHRPATKYNTLVIRVSIHCVPLPSLYPLPFVTLAQCNYRRVYTLDCRCLPFASGRCTHTQTRDDGRKEAFGEGRYGRGHRLNIKGVRFRGTSLEVARRRR